MEAFFTSLGLVALAEIGDKTQLLAFALGARFRKPLPIIAGILLATLTNHALAASIGAWIASHLTARTVRWISAGVFILCGIWACVPDRLEEERTVQRRSILFTTAIAFFLVEMGDKTQIATAALGARFHPLAAIIAGTTVGMMLADAPAVWMGERLSGRINFKTVRYAAAALFIITGIVSFIGA
jgi:putative Ca2+/H+ antiporter (TMEM165/GDT1 family)